MTGVMTNQKMLVLIGSLIILWSVKLVSGDRNGLFDEIAGSTKGVCDGLAWGFSSLTLILCIIIVIIMVKYCQAREFRKENGLYMQISMTDLLETIHLGGCLMALDQLYQEDTRAPLVRDIYIVTGWWGPVAVVRWGRRVYATQISGKGLDDAMAIPTRIVISGRMARRLGAIPLGEIYVRLLRYNGEIATVLPRGKPMMTSSGWSQVGKKGPEVVTHNLLRPNRESPKAVEEPTQIAIIKKDRNRQPDAMMLVDLNKANREKRDTDGIYADLS